MDLVYTLLLDIILKFYAEVLNFVFKFLVQVFVSLYLYIDGLS